MFLDMFLSQWGPNVGTLGQEYLTSLSSLNDGLLYLHPSNVEVVVDVSDCCLVVLGDFLQWKYF